jgi:hypothetical protein
MTNQSEQSSNSNLSEISSNQNLVKRENKRVAPNSPPATEPSKRTNAANFEEHHSDNHSIEF